MLRHICPDTPFPSRHHTHRPAPFHPDPPLNSKVPPLAINVVMVRSKSLVTSLKKWGRRNDVMLTGQDVAATLVVAMLTRMLPWRFHQPIGAPQSFRQPPRRHPPSGRGSEKLGQRLRLCATATRRKSAIPPTSQEQLKTVFSFLSRARGEFQKLLGVLKSVLEPSAIQGRHFQKDRVPPRQYTLTWKRIEGVLLCSH